MAEDEALQLQPRVSHCLLYYLLMPTRSCRIEVFVCTAKPAFCFQLQFRRVAWEYSPENKPTLKACKKMFYLLLFHDTVQQFGKLFIYSRTSVCKTLKGIPNSLQMYLLGGYPLCFIFTFDAGIDTLLTTPTNTRLTCSLHLLHAPRYSGASSVCRRAHRLL